jgi:hypothetical protein
LAGSAAGSAGFSATAPSPDSLRFGSSAGASTTFVGEALPSTEVLAFLAATTGSAAAGAALVFSVRAGDDMVFFCLRRRVEGVVERRWRRRGELICARAEYGVRRREKDLLPARETRSKSSAALRCGCGGRVPGGRALRLAAAAAVFEFLPRGALAPKSAAGAAALRISREPRGNTFRRTRGRRCLFAERFLAGAARHRERYAAWSAKDQCTSHNQTCRQLFRRLHFPQ